MPPAPAGSAAETPAAAPSTATTHETELDERVWDFLRNPDERSPGWVRIAMLQDRTAGDIQPMIVSSVLVGVWNATTQHDRVRHRVR